MCRWNITGKNKMKKSIILSSFILSLVAFFAFTTPTASLQTSDNNISISSQYVSTIDVVKISGSGNFQATNYGFYGKYDEETNYIEIYNRNSNKLVASGKAQINYNTKGKAKNYNARLGDYYFNV